MRAHEAKRSPAKREGSGRRAQSKRRRMRAHEAKRSPAKRESSEQEKKYGGARSEAKSREAGERRAQGSELRAQRVTEQNKDIPFLIIFASHRHYTGMMLSGVVCQQFMNQFYSRNQNHPYDNENILSDFCFTACTYPSSWICERIWH